MTPDPAADPESPRTPRASKLKLSRRALVDRLGSYLMRLPVLLWQFFRGPEPAFKTDWFKKLIDVSTLAVIAVGLYFAYDQAKKLSESIDSSTWNNVTTQELTLDKLFIDIPEARRYFYKGIYLSAEDPHYDRIAAIAEFTLDFIDSYYASEKHLTIESSDPEKWRAYFVSVFSNSPIACDILKSNLGEYSGDLASLAEGPCCWTDEVISR